MLFSCGEYTLIKKLCRIVKKNMYPEKVNLSCWKSLTEINLNAKGQLLNMGSHICHNIHCVN